MDWQKFSNIGAFVVALVFLGIQSYVWYKHGDIGVSSLAMLGVIAVFLLAAGIINYKAFHARPSVGRVETKQSSKSYESPDSRMFMDRSPDDLVALYRGNTSAEGDRRVHPYIGKWMKVSAKVGDMRHLADGRSQISFHGYGAAGVHVIMLFAKDWLDRVSVLTKDQQITVRGKLAVVEPYVVVLEPCELID